MSESEILSLVGVGTFLFFYTLIVYRRDWGGFR